MHTLSADAELDFILEGGGLLRSSEAFFFNVSAQYEGTVVVEITVDGKQVRIPFKFACNPCNISQPAKVCSMVGWLSSDGIEHSLLSPRSTSKSFARLVTRRQLASPQPPLPASLPHLSLPHPSLITPSPTPPRISPSLTHTPLLPHSLTCSLPYFLTPSLPHSLPPSLPHSLT
eukprot:3520284-Rhodomonas_salina.1